MAQPKLGLAAKVRTCVAEVWYFFCLFDPAPFTQFRDAGVRPAPRGASRALGYRSGCFCDGVARVRTLNLEHQKRMLYPLCQPHLVNLRTGTEVGFYKGMEAGAVVQT